MVFVIFWNFLTLSIAKIHAYGSFLDCCIAIFPLFYLIIKILSNILCDGFEGRIILLND